MCSKRFGRCQGELTAKSRLGRLNSQPFPFHVQQAIGQYTMVAQKKAKIIDGMIRPRSKDPPMTSWTVQAQKSIWYRQKTISGSRTEPGEGADMTFFRPKLSMLPMKGLAVREYASE